MVATTYMDYNDDYETFMIITIMIYCIDKPKERISFSFSMGTSRYYSILILTEI